MRILLLSPPYVPFYMRNARCDFVSLSDTQWYPILLGYAGAWLEKCGHEVRFVDAPAQRLSHEETERIVTTAQPDWLVVYTGRISEDNDVTFADRLVEKLKCQAVFVGPYASINPGQTLGKSKAVDLLVSGEFEKPLQDLIEGGRPENIPNLVYRSSGEVKTNPPRAYLGTTELDDIPFVSEFFKRHVRLADYKTVSELHPFMDILTGRGCVWGRCTYCLWVNTYIKGPVYNTRSIENVLAEMEYIRKDIPEIRSVMIQDDTFTEERAATFSEAKIRAGNRLPWSCYLRANVSYETLRAMKGAQCRNVHVGFESASPEILRNIHKGITKERMTRFVEDAKKAGVRIHGDFAIGFPGETKATVEETVTWACQIRPHTAQFQLMIPFPGTPFKDELEKKGYLKDSFPNYPELSAEQMEDLAKRAYKRFYMSPSFLLDVIRHPHEMFLSRLGTYMRAMPSIFWKRYQR